MAHKFFPETGHFVAGGFHDYFMKDGEAEGIYRYGYPISEEFTDPGLECTVQYFERARFEHNADIANNDQDVVLGLVGAELVKALGIADSELMPHFEAREENPTAEAETPETPQAPDETTNTE